MGGAPRRWPPRRSIAIRAAVAIAVGAAMLSSCADHGAGRPDCPAGETCLNVAISAAPMTLDPPRSFMAVESDILHNLLVGLTSWDAQARTVPGMAESWSVSPDGLTWTFHLRKATWSDGVPMTANDFVFSFRRLLDPATGAPYNTPLIPIAGGAAVAAGKARPETLGLFAPDPRTLVIRLDRPVATLPDIMAFQAALPVPEHVVRKWGDNWIRPEHFVGNGAYVLTAWDTSGDMIMRANPRYFEPGHRCFTQVRQVVTTDLVTAERTVASGEMDLTDRFRSRRGDYVKRAMPGFIRNDPMGAPYWLSFNLDRPGLNDLRVRQALALTIDREFIAGRINKAGERPLYSYTPPNLPGYQPPVPVWAGWTPERRRQVAKELMRAAGYSRQKPLRLELSYANSTDRALPALLQADWRDIGVELSFMPQESAVFYADLRIRKFDIGVSSWITDVLEPGIFLELLKTGQDTNYSDYANPRFDALIDEANRQPDAARRLALMREAEEVVLRDLPVAPMYNASERYLVNPRITGFHSNAIGTHRYEFLCRK